MKELDRAKAVFGAAMKDFTALVEMRDNHKIADEIFGFHAQQAIEKLLKAWMAALGMKYPQSHNIIFLLAALEENKQDVAAYWDFAEFNAFAVQFRYEAYSDLGATLDRAEAVRKVGGLVSKVEAVLKEIEQGW